MKIRSLVTLLALTASPALAQQQILLEGESEVLTERRCDDGSFAQVVMQGNMVLLEIYQVFSEDGRAFGYQNAFDANKSGRAYEEFSFFQCPKKQQG